MRYTMVSRSGRSHGWRGNRRASVRDAVASKFTNFGALDPVTVRKSQATQHSRRTKVTLPSTGGFGDAKTQEED